MNFAIVDQHIFDTRQQAAGSTGSTAMCGNDEAKVKLVDYMPV